MLKLDIHTEIHFLVVSYGNTIPLLNLMQSVLAQSDGDWRLTVVHNGGSKFQIPEWVNAEKRMSVIAPFSNLGYFGGADFAYKKLIRERTSATWWIVCNSDLLFSPSFVEQLKKVPKTKAIIAPRIFEETNGCEQNPHLVKRLNRYEVMLRLVVLSNDFTYNLSQIVYRKKRKFGRWNQRYHHFNDTRFESGSFQIYAPHGSAIIFHKEVLSEGFDLNQTWLYGEELIVAEYARSRDIPIFYISELNARHVSGSSTSKLDRGHSRKLQYKALRKHYRNTF